MIAQVEAMMVDIVASQEFRNLLGVMVLKHFGAKLKELDDDDSGKDTVVDNPDTNLTPEGLGWHFRQKLTRRPNSQESLEDCAAHFKALLAKGIDPVKVLDALKKRGRHVEPIWDFLGRFEGEVALTAPASGMKAALERVAATKKMIEARRHAVHTGSR